MAKKKQPTPEETEQATIDRVLSWLRAELEGFPQAGEVDDELSDALTQGNRIFLEHVIARIEAGAWQEGDPEPTIRSRAKVLHVGCQGSDGEDGIVLGADEGTLRLAGARLYQEVELVFRGPRNG